MVLVYDRGVVQGCPINFTIKEDILKARYR